jgi:hypothetical protein
MGATLQKLIIYENINCKCYMVLDIAASILSLKVYSPKNSLRY